MSWLAIATLGASTYLMRASFLLGWRSRPPEAVARTLRFVPAAVLPTLAVSSILGRESADLRALAALVAVLIAWRTRNITYVVLGGLAVLWLLKALR